MCTKAYLSQARATRTAVSMIRVQSSLKVSSKPGREVLDGHTLEAVNSGKSGEGGTVIFGPW